jgi:V-type H+-transporting ATPase subunit A
MNVGFRPRLEARPSLYDLLAYRNIERLSAGLASPTSIQDIPLPPSPSPSLLSPKPESTQEEYPEPAAQSATMAPKKAAQDADVEEQYGEFRSLLPLRTQANPRCTGSIYSVSGYETAPIF